MKVIIAGGRNIIEYSLLLDAVENAKFEITEIVSGGARGVDEMAMNYATLNDIKFTEFKADWDKNGLAAGPIRNRLMADYADALIAIWDGSSSGTKNMINEATKRGLKVHVQRI